MCVAIHKPAKAQIPSLKTLKKCWDCNPDGAGIAIREKSGIRIHKGFMEWTDFEIAFNHLAAGNHGKEMFFHFRIATHGGVNAGCTHPFPVTADIKHLKAIDFTAPYVLIHNGVLDCTPETPDISDTMEFCKRLSAGNHLSNIDNVLSLLDGFLGNSKVAIMLPDRTVKAGAWTEIDGVYYSNTHWQNTPRFLDWGLPQKSSYGFAAANDSADYGGYDDDYYGDCFKPTAEERKHLDKGVCPMCLSSNMYTDSDGVICCDECLTMWDYARG